MLAVPFDRQLVLLFMLLFIVLVVRMLRHFLESTGQQICWLLLLQWRQLLLELLVTSDCFNYKLLNLRLLEKHRKYRKMKNFSIENPSVVLHYYVVHYYLNILV